MILDMSGSMSGQMATGTVERVAYSSCASAKKLVYPLMFMGSLAQGFTLRIRLVTNTNRSPMAPVAVESGVGLVQLINSEPGSADYTNAFESLLPVRTLLEISLLVDNGRHDLILRPW